MASDFAYIWELMVVAVFLGAASILEKNVRFFHRHFIPNAIIAGFIGLFLGPQFLNLVPFDADRLGIIVYHLMSVGFISLALKERSRRRSKDILNTGIFIVSTYVLQGIVGFGFSLLLAFTVIPDLFPAFGLLLPLGYGQGAAQAYSIGRQWEASGFSNGGNIGLSIAAMGLLWACLGGIPLMNFLVRIKKIRPTHSEVGEYGVKGLAGRSREAIEEPAEKFTVQLFLIGVIYLATYLTLVALSGLLSQSGTLGLTVSNMFWGFSFIIATIYAILVRTVLDRLKAKKILKQEITSDFLLDRISVGAFDFMIAASIAAISISILREYLLPTLVIGIIGGIVTISYTVFICKRIYRTDVLENILALFGMLTGIVSTGLALTKEIDPGLESSASENIVLGSGVGLFLGLPLMLLLSVPVMGIVLNRPVLFLVTMLALVAYFAVLLFLMYINRPSKE